MLSLVAVIVVGLALIGAGCGSSDSSTDTGSSSSSTDSSDSGSTGSGPPQGSMDKIAGWGLQSPETNPFDKGGSDGLSKAAEILGAKPNFLSNITFDQSPQVVERLVRDGYPVLISNGSGFADTMIAAAQKYPDKWFMVYADLASTKGLPNLVGIKISWSQMGYLAAMIACQSSPNKKIGLVVAQPIPAYTHAVGGAVQGAKEGCGDEKNMLTTWTGTFDDNAKTKQATQALISQGAQVIFDFQDAATVGVQAAVKANPKVKYVGTTFDAAAGIPKQIITSVVNDFDVGYGQTAQLLKDKKLEPKVYTYGIEQGGLVLAPFTNVSSKIAAEGKASYDDIKNGKLVVDVNKEVSK
jgi:basic membrane lipoprotein Med (substrate-binding protein (PBP1-ABC) superfamily)